MTNQVEQDENVNAAVSSAPPSNAELARMLFRVKLKLITNYVLDAFAPIAAVLALIVAVMAINANHAGLAQIEKSTASIERLNTNLSAAKAEQQQLKSAIAQKEMMQGEASRKQNEQMAKIIQNVNQLQLKMKISPTLEEQMRQPASSAAVTSGITSATVVSASASPAASAGKNSPTQGQVLTKAIEKFNNTKRQ